ncbi:MAG: Kelch repeat-containing protein [Myxococcales bacterium]
MNVISASCTGNDILAADGGVQFLRFTVLAGGAVVDAEPPVSVASHTLQLPQTPLGAVTIEVEALSDQTSSAQVLAQGSSGPFQVPGDGSVSQESVTIFLRATDRSAQTNDAKTPTKCTNLTFPRAYHSQALMSDGKVLIYGGVQYGTTTGYVGTIDWSQALAIPPGVASSDEHYLDNAEIYDPTTGEFAATSAWNQGSGAPTARAFAQLLPFTNGAAVVVGGEEDPATDGVTGSGVGAPLVPAWHGGVYSPTASPQWAENPTGLAHSHGCLAQDTSGDALLAGGYAGVDASGNPIVSTADLLQMTVTTNATAESYSPTKWPPYSKTAGPFPAGNGPQGAVADQACSGLDGVIDVLQSVIAEVGGAWIDSSGNAWIVQDYYLEQFGVDGGVGDFAPAISGALLQLQQPRARTKAAPLIVTQPSGAAGGATERADALLVTGGLTCTPASSDVLECAPAFASGTSGQLANSPDSYFWNDAGTNGTAQDVGRTTELITFPPDPTKPGDHSVVPSIAGPVMSTERIDHCAVPLPDGRVVIIGGLGGADASSFGTVSNIEVAFDDPDAGLPLPAVGLHEAAGNLLTPRAGMACTLLQDGSILVTGGLQTVAPLSGTQQQIRTLNTAEIYRPLPLAP